MSEDTHYNPFDVPYSLSTEEANQTQITSFLIEHKQNTPIYIKAFFDRFSHTTYETTVSQIWNQARFAAQMKMGGKGKPDSAQEMKTMSIQAVNMNGANDFLYQFHHGNHLAKAGRLSRKVTKIIKNFEKEDMDHEKPSNVFLTFFLGLDKLWEQRHYELFYLKYCCVNYADDEIYLIDFIKTLTSESKTKTFSGYDGLVENFKQLIDQINKGTLSLKYKVDSQRHRQLYEAESVQRQKDLDAFRQTLKNKDVAIQYLKDEINEKNHQLDQKNEEIISQNRQLDQKNEEIISQNRQLDQKNEEILRQKRQLETQSKEHKAEVQAMKKDLEDIKAFIKNNSSPTALITQTSKPVVSTSLFKM